MSRTFCILAMALTVLQPPDGVAEPARPDGVDVAVSASAERLRTGELLTVTLTVSYPDDMEIMLPDAQALRGDFTIVETRDHPPALVSAGRVRARREWVLEPGLPGAYTIKPLTVVANAPDGTESTHATTGLSVQIQSVLPSGEERPALRDIAPCFPIGGRHVALWIAGVGCVIALTLLLVAIRRRRRTAAPVAGGPRVVALDELDQLAQSTSLRTAPAELQRIVATFLIDHYGVAPPRETPEAVLQHAGGEDVPPTVVALVQSFFANCDRVRFSRPADARDDTEGLIRQCRSLLEACPERQLEVDDAL